jgi:two-component system, NarL family, response regulator LiaR
MQGIISVVLVDDHTIVRRGIRVFLDLESDIRVIAEAGSGEAAVKIAAEYHPNVMLLDLIMPGGINGVEATRQVKQVSPHTQIVILTSYADNDHVLPALRAGALSYVFKDVDVEGLVDVVRKAVRGEALLNSRITAHLVQEVRDLGTDGLSYLSEREHEVLLLVAHGYSNANIAQRLIISERTVKSHVSNILSKLNMADRTQLAVFAWQRGIISKQHLQLAGDI